MTVTDEDREAASAFLWCMDLETQDELIQEFTTIRLAARRKALEDAAKVVDRAAAQSITLGRLAANIRAMIEGEGK